MDIWWRHDVSQFRYRMGARREQTYPGAGRCMERVGRNRDVGAMRSRWRQIRC